VPLRNISGPSFWFVLSFTDWEHCDRTAGNITKEILNEPLGYFLGTFYGKILDVPMVFLMGTLWLHDLGNCKCTDHFLTQEHCNPTAGEIAKEILNEPLRKILGTFYRKTLNVPMVFLMGTSWSHDLEHCKCTGHFLTQGLGTF